MATADDIEAGFYRYPDLEAKKYVSSRSDLHDKQKKLGFPFPQAQSQSRAFLEKRSSRLVAGYNRKAGYRAPLTH